ncbi:MAG: S-layer homology domain-containing protein [Oscillospiraceae bacterium]
MKRKLCSLLALLLSLSVLLPSALAAETNADLLAGSAAYVCKTVSRPQVGTIGGEWAILGLARSGYAVPDQYYQDYYATMEQYVKACKGVLHDKKYTEYARVIVALSAIGKDARNVAGYDLTKPLGDYDKTIWQGLNGPIWALIALDSGGYPMPENGTAKTQATRQMYIDRILECQLSDGGWSLTGGTSAGSKSESSDPDITGMALQALAKYQDQASVVKATEEALTCISKAQNEKGGYGSWGTTNLESTVQVLVGLTELGISLNDPRFVKNGNTVLDDLLTYRKSDGSFVHVRSGDDGSNQMATEQGFYGLTAAVRASEGKNSLYRMGDSITIPDAVSTGAQKGQGLPGKHADVKSVPISAPGTTFEDAAFSPQIAAIEALAVRGVISGRGDGKFDPDAGMTRAEFSSIVVKALGLTPKAGGSFADVVAGQWYAPYVGTAYKYGIVAGTTETTFTPGGTITRQEAAVMVMRAAKLCGLDTEMGETAVRDMLAQFPDYTQSAQWARPALAFCYQSGILNQSDLSIRSADAITRAEIAQMLFHLLGTANLL